MPVKGPVFMTTREQNRKCKWAHAVAGWSQEWPAGNLGRAPVCTSVAIGTFGSNHQLDKGCLRFMEKGPLYGKTLIILFPNFTWRHLSTLLCSNVVKFVWLEIGKTVRVNYLTNKQQFECLSNCRYCANRAHNLPGPAPNNVLTVIFHPNRFTFGGVIAERVNTVFCPIEYFRKQMETKANRVLLFFCPGTQFPMTFEITNKEKKIYNGCNGLAGSERALKWDRVPPLQCYGHLLEQVLLLLYNRTM